MEIEDIIKSSNKAEFLEMVQKSLVTTDKAMAVLIDGREDGKWTTRILTLGIKEDYEAVGILQIGMMDFWIQGCVEE